MKHTKFGRKAVVGLAFFNVLLLCISVFCAWRTHQNNERINRAARAFRYTETAGEVILTLTDGQTAHMIFGATAVRITDSHRYTDSMHELLLFVRAYGAEHGYTFERANTDLLGEFKLHALLYRIGYKRSQTGDLDWDYGRDPRWYVNAASSVIGRCGL